MDENVSTSVSAMRDWVYVGFIDRGRGLLSGILPEEIVRFGRHVEALLDAVYRWNLWHAADIIADGCSDDKFMDFRGWLISMGRPNYERALADVESLAEIASAPALDFLFSRDSRPLPRKCTRGERVRSSRGNNSESDRSAGGCPIPTSPQAFTNCGASSVGRD